MNNIITKIKEKRNLKESTLKVYKSALKRIEKFNGEPLTADFKINPKKNLKKITQHSNYFTKKFIKLFDCRS